MASKLYHSLKDLCPESYNWFVKVRIIRSWRGVSNKGEGFKALNLLLLDDKNDRIHAFVPASVIDKHESSLTEGSICTIANFTVKDYKADEKFRCVNSGRQIMFTSYTEVKKLNSDDLLIAKNYFDFYDLSDLPDIANQNVFLTDVVGVIEKDYPLANLINKHGKPQTLIKFNIVDGRSSVNVTFWDSFGEQFQEALNNVKETPPIVIIASAKISSWQGNNQSSPNIEVSNVTATTFYLNYEHENVRHLRKLIGTKLFQKYDFSRWRNTCIPVFSIAEIQQLGNQYIQKEVICAVRVKSINDHVKWHIYECPSCYKKIELFGEIFKCHACSDRTVPHPYKRWFLNVEVFDQTGTIDVVLLDREVRTILGRSADEFGHEDPDNSSCPSIVRNLINKFYTLKLEITRQNVENAKSTFYASGIFSTFNYNLAGNINEITQTDGIEESITQPSGSTLHLDDFADLSFQSPDVKKNVRKTPAKSASKKASANITKKKS